VFEDETGFTLHPRLGMGWAKRGRRFRIPTTSQHRTRLNIFGWVAPLLGKTGLIRHPQGNREGFLLCLRQLYRRLRGYKIWLYVDRARWHKGEDIDIFLENHRRLSIEYLPPYQPGLNVQERIWRRWRKPGSLPLKRLIPRLRPKSSFYVTLLSTFVLDLKNVTLL